MRQQARKRPDHAVLRQRRVEAADLVGRDWHESKVRMPGQKCAGLQFTLFRFKAAGAEDQLAAGLDPVRHAIE